MNPRVENNSANQGLSVQRLKQLTNQPKKKVVLPGWWKSNSHQIILGNKSFLVRTSVGYPSVHPGLVKGVWFPMNLNEEGSIARCPLFEKYQLNPLPSPRFCPHKLPSTIEPSTWIRGKFKYNCPTFLWNRNWQALRSLLLFNHLDGN